MPRKLGLHLLRQIDPEELRPLIAEWQPSVIKFLGPPGYLLNVERVSPPGTLFVQRYWWQDPAYGNPNEYELRMKDEDPETAYRIWLGLADVPPLARRPNYYIESFNESGLGESYLRFEAHRTRRLFQEFGLKSCVINCASGVTTAADWARARDVGLLDALRETGSVIGVHGYAGFMLNFGHGDAQPPQAGGPLANPPHHYLQTRQVHPPEMLGTWQAFRVAQDYAALKSLGYGDLKFILTEFGIDNIDVRLYGHYTNGKEAHSWRAFAPYWAEQGLLENTPPDVFYARELLYGEAQLQAYPFVLGATIFTVGSDPGTLWEPFDIYPGVMQQMLALWREAARPAPVIPPNSAIIEGHEVNDMSNPTPAGTVMITVHFTSGRKLSWRAPANQYTVKSLVEILDKKQSLVFVESQKVRHVIPALAVEYVTLTNP